MTTSGARILPPSIVAIFAIAFLSAGSSVSCGSGDCGYQARFKKPDGVNNVEIRIQRVTAETVGSDTSCGYQFISTRAAKVEIRGAALPERVGENRLLETYVSPSDQGGVDYYYEAPPDFDPGKDVIRIENTAGYTYSSSPTSIKESTDNYFVALKR